ncbi:CXXC-20-CXXC protein [Oikeobacillus pervagus]|uniref:CXXC-20-CXXC protein n=1 Tax=Oikeobacillus pervagus TaxID=1325931 RepID=A0AAJ1T032_9BACI|nr:CXXC-20-CXXC protein [Oikeobacillus pervagus]
MAHCTNCHIKWSVKEIWSLGFSKNGKNCPNCGHKQYISSETQRIFTLGYVSLLFIIIFPFFIKLSNEDEFFW